MHEILRKNKKLSDEAMREMNDKIYKSLSQASKDVMMDKVEHLIISWTTSDGQIHTVYDKKDDASFVEMLGGLEMVKDSIINNYAPMENNQNDN